MQQRGGHGASHTIDERRAIKHEIAFDRIVRAVLAVLATGATAAGE